MWLKRLLLGAALGLAAQMAQAVDVNFGVIRGLTTSNLANDNGTLQNRLQAVGSQLKWQGPYGGTPWDALNAGQVDITFTTATNAAAVASNSRFKIFGYQAPDLDGEGVWVKKDAGIQSLADLKGRRIATDRGGSGHHVLLKALDKAGLSLKDVQVSYFEPADALAAFNGGQVDALATWRTFGASAEAKGGGVKLVSGRDVGSENVLIYIVREAFAKDHPEAVKAVFEALRESAAQSARDPEATARVWARLGGLPIEQARIFVPPASREFLPVTAALVPTLEQTASLFVKYKVIPKVPSYAPLILDVNPITPIRHQY
ncbi:MAG: aliphatic sulfonate ABC transporter substrate-binding protein [Xenophilus sp.]